MGFIKSFSLVVLVGIAAFGLTVSSARAASLIVNSDGGSATAQEKFVEDDQTDLSGGGDVTKSQTLGNDQRDDYSWDGYDILVQPLVDGFRLDNIDESSYDMQKSLDDGYVQKFIDDGDSSFDQ